ncbi:hypothetical protein ABFX02_05G063400 [Erythranthe guttata]
MDATCFCSRRPVMKTSWTDLNPGRRYTNCDKFRKPGGCNYFVWTDPPMCERSRQIIPGLLRRINKQEEEMKKKQRFLWMTLICSWFLLYLVI